MTFELTQILKNCADMTELMIKEKGHEKEYRQKFDIFFSGVTWLKNNVSITISPIDGEKGLSYEYYWRENPDTYCVDVTTYPEGKLIQRIANDFYCEKDFISDIFNKIMNADDKTFIGIDHPWIEDDYFLTYPVNYFEEV